MGSNGIKLDIIGIILPGGVDKFVQAGVDRKIGKGLRTRSDNLLPTASWVFMPNCFSASLLHETIRHCPSQVKQD